MSAALQRLMEHRSELLAFLRKQGASDAEAEDLLQSSLVRGLEPWRSPPADESVVPWFYRVLRNALIDQARRASAAGRALERYAREVPDVEPEIVRDGRRALQRLLLPAERRCVRRVR
jgi:DNA-directed RNA polymerase specialized sigma24 family protein